jgi:fructose-1,6-bisphosphatase/inositol monophosphatase family enzyme
MTFTRADLDRLMAIVAEAAAAEIMPRFRSLEAHGVREKTSMLDVVTDADEKAEWRMRDSIARAFPSAAFIGEESVERDPSLLAKIASADLAIIIDPVDGTSNFAWGLPLFGVLAAVTMKGETVAGIIHDPVCHDWRLALRGEGAWAVAKTGATRDLKVARAAAPEDMAGTASWHMAPEPYRNLIARNLPRVRGAFAYRCAAYEYRLICDGHIHYGLHYKLMPWDHAAGVLIHSEAGGYSARYDGSAYAPSQTTGGLLLAPDKPSWQALHAALLT